MKGGAQVDINFNEFMSNLIGVFLVDTNQNTTITTNTFTGDDAPDDGYFGVVVFTGSTEAPAATRAVIHKNDFTLQSTHGVSSIAVTAQQPGRVASISSAITKNSFDLSGSATGGVFYLDTSNASVSANRFDGSGNWALWVGGSKPVSGVIVSSNTGLGGFSPGSGFDIIFRDNTSKSYVGPGQSATVSDIGVNNTIKGGDEPTPEGDQDTLDYSEYSGKQSGARYTRQLQDLVDRLRPYHQ